MYLHILSWRLFLWCSSVLRPLLPLIDETYCFLVIFEHFLADVILIVVVDDRYVILLRHRRMLIFMLLVLLNKKLWFQSSFSLLLLWLLLLDNLGNYNNFLIRFVVDIVTLLPEMVLYKVLQVLEVLLSLLVLLVLYCLLQ
jgi:hypothetical protein